MTIECDFCCRTFENIEELRSECCSLSCPYDSDEHDEVHELNFHEDYEE